MLAEIPPETACFLLSVQLLSDALTAMMNTNANRVMSAFMEPPRNQILKVN